MPVGQMGTVQYVLTSVPTTTPSYIQVDFSVSTKGHQSAEVSLASVAGAASARAVGWAGVAEGGKGLFLFLLSV